MRVRFDQHTIIRDSGSECLVSCMQSGGSTLLRNARPFLDVLRYNWRTVDELLTEVAEKLACAIVDVRADAEVVWRELASQRFVEIEPANEGWVASCETDDAQVANRIRRLTDEEDAESPISVFYLRHNLPCELHVDLTDRCNERCVHCYIPKGGGAVLPTDIALKLLREFREAQGLTVFVTGGECMLHPDFAVILREAKRIGLNIIVMSNLSVCTDERVALLKEIDPQFVNVSLYSMVAEEHDAITQLPGSWDRTIRAIWELQHAGVHVRLATPVLKQNRNAISTLRRFAADHHMHDVLDCDIIGKLDHDCSNQAHALSVDEMELVVRAHRDALAKEPLPACKCAPDARVCDVGDGHLCVNARGEYYPCDGFHGMVLGNVKTDALLDVWRGAKLNRLRALKNRDFGACANCKDRPWCKVCMMRNFNETGNMFTHASERCEMAAMYRRIWEGK